MLSEVGCSVPAEKGMKAYLLPSAPSCHSRQKRRSLSFHSTSTDSSSQPAPNRADAFIVGSPPRLKVSLSPATPRTRSWPIAPVLLAKHSSLLSDPAQEAGRKSDRPQPKARRGVPVPGPYADSGGPSSG